ncbi:hypothetical protein J421_0853 [Gemmatirosa kalamazoonensis]|uniref:Polysaccharide biosynthesis protein n=1 Tax=Gemmatirosa kalamazoonensis TaxID=861299 RepID=W0RDJ6_9BACT|nr:hypothetical protein [Gemmatirosa kalamazoonensis]AHG88390.1 hypothetical protein J421_0853 [Gemmatirosa kalamazoonensis]
MSAKIATARPTARASYVRASKPRASAAGRDAVRYGAAVAVAVALGAVQVFVIPRRLDVASFGAWRVFLVYAAYVGALHVGLADGAFLRWAGRAPSEIGGEWRIVARWLLAWQGALLAAALAAAPWLPPTMRAFAIGLAACAAGTNLATLAAYALQTAGDFRGAGLVAALPPALFVPAALALRTPTLAEVLGAYAASWGVAAVLGAWRVMRVLGGEPQRTQRTQRRANSLLVSSASSASSAVQTNGTEIRMRTLLRDGLPVLGANLAAGVALFADRIVVSASVPVARFAHYGFASSVMVAASAATQALSRVALSHAARRVASARAAFLDGYHDVVATVAGAALALVPAFEALVARLLPAYVPALPIVRALAFGAPFAVAVHVVLVGTLQSYGMVRRQLALELVGLALVLAACGACLAAGTPLWGVAAAASGAATTTWGIGVLFVRRAVPAPIRSRSARFALVAAAQGAALLVALATSARWETRTLVYVLLAAVPTLLAARAAREHGWR